MNVHQELKTDIKTETILFIAGATELHVYEKDFFLFTFGSLEKKQKQKKQNNPLEERPIVKQGKESISVF